MSYEYYLEISISKGDNPFLKCVVGTQMNRLN